MGPVRLTIGSTFASDYKVVRALAEGDSRSVYVVEQESTGKQLALKVIAPELVPDEESRQRFMAEVRVGGRLQTEHIVDVRAAGMDAATGYPWLAMELLEGNDLAHAMAKQPDRPLPEWDEVLTQICHGLEVVHAAGVVHGALFPESVFLAVPGSDGDPFRVELLDLGMPKAARDVQAKERAHVPWLAPEQVRGEAVTASTDVWSIGMLAFRMLTGRHYLKSVKGTGYDLEAVRKEIADGPLEPATARAKALGATAMLPRAFDAWFARCVARDPTSRWPNAHDALEGAADVLGEVSGIADAVVDDKSPSKKGPPPLPPMMQAIAKNPKPAILAILGLVAIALGGGFGLGAILKPKGGMSADSPRARATAWARGSKEECAKACDGGDAVACHGLGMMHLYGLKVPRDEAKATQFFQMACDKGDVSACGSLAARYLNGEGVTEDKSKALELYRRACDKADTVSCIDLAEMYQNGTGVTADAAQAKALYEKACKAGFTEVCR
jgi:hypothetical protein